MPLSPEQQYLVDLAISGKSFFFTGDAGAGKTTALKAISSAVKVTSENVFVVATIQYPTC